MKLKDMVELAANNDECVILKVKEGQEFNLISLGCFNGNETMFRLTKGWDMTYTVFIKGGKSFSRNMDFGWGLLASDATEKMGRLIQDCIERDFGIQCGY